MKFFALARQGAPIPLLNEGRDFFDLIHVGDVALAVQKALERGQGAYNIGSGRPTTVHALAAAIIQASGSSSQLVFGPPTNNYHSKFLEIARAANELDWRPAVELSTGLGGLPAHSFR
jgi:nucleoside-diphosphate-sugar epimerase